MCLLAIVAMMYTSSQRSARMSSTGVTPQSAFQSFAERVLREPEDTRSAIVDDFLSTASVPVLTPTTATFLYKGFATSVHVASDANGWDWQSSPLEKLDGTNLWFRESNFEETARIDYKLVIDREEWIVDPLNPARIPGGFGENSELAMPGYVQPEEIQRTAGVAAGTMIDTTITSRHLGNTREMSIYLPPGYSDAKEYGLILFHDGLEFLALAHADNTLDNLIGRSAIDPLIGVFLPPVERELEYATDKTDLFERFVIEEVVPFVESNYSVASDPMQRATAGASYGAVISAQLCFRNSHVFGLCGLFSTAFQPKNGLIMREAMEGEIRPIRMYLDWGTYEPGIARMGRTFSSRMAENGYILLAREWPEGHSWGSWRAHVDEMLIFLFGADQQ